MNSLPCSLRPFEFYMLADDRPYHPMVFQIRLQFLGRLDFGRLCDAARLIKQGHPLLGARIQGVGAWIASRAQWTELEAHEPPLVLALEAPAEPVRIDIAVSVGWRAWLVRGPEGDMLLAYFHHACCDAIGAMKFLEDLLVCYQDPAAIPPSPGQTLRDSTGDTWLASLCRTHHDCRRIADYFRARPRPLAVPVRVSPHLTAQAGDAPAVFLEGAELGGLLQSARSAGVTVNDLLLRDLFLTLFDWQASRDSSPRGTVRVAVPVNLRSGAARTASNCVGIIFLDRGPGRDSDRMLKSLAVEMAGVRRWRTALGLLRALEGAAAAPGGVQVLVAPRCAATAVFSNLGRVFESGQLTRINSRVVAGEAVLMSVELLPPIRPLTHVAFAAVTYAGRMCLSLNAARAVLSSEQANDLLDRFVAQVRSRSIGHLSLRQ